MEVSVHAYGGSPAQQTRSKRPAGKTANGFLENVIRTQASQGGLDGVYSRLSPASQKALEGLKAGRSNMTRDQWTARLHRQPWQRHLSGGPGVLRPADGPGRPAPKRVRRLEGGPAGVPGRVGQDL